MSREADLNHLYRIFEDLEAKVGGMQRLKDCTGYMDWPERGVYIFFSRYETRDTTVQFRLTRVGTHAVSSGSKTSLWNRLRTHRGAKTGTYEGGGNHRGSVFRKRVGEAIIERDQLHEEYPRWGEGSSAGRERRLTELDLEKRVSEYIRELPFLWVRVDDESGPESARAYIERNAISLVSNFGTEPIDARDENWLGKASRSEGIRRSGLWNVNHVGEEYDPAFLERFSESVEDTSAI